MPDYIGSVHAGNVGTHHRFRQAGILPTRPGMALTFEIPNCVTGTIAALVETFYGYLVIVTLLDRW